MEDLKVGDSVVSLVTEWDVELGNTYEVLEVWRGGNDLSILGVDVRDDVGAPYYLLDSEFKLKD